MRNSFVICKAYAATPRNGHPSGRLPILQNNAAAADHVILHPNSRETGLTTGPPGWVLYGILCFTREYKSPWDCHPTVKMGQQSLNFQPWWRGQAGASVTSDKNPMTALLKESF